MFYVLKRLIPKHTRNETERQQSALDIGSKGVAPKMERTSGRVRRTAVHTAQNQTNITLPPLLQTEEEGETVDTRNIRYMRNCCGEFRLTFIFSPDPPWYVFDTSMRELL